MWFAPLNDPMKLLIYSLAFGLVHLFVGLGIKGYMLIKNGQTLDFFCDVVLWYAFLIGLILMLIPTDIFASIMGSKVVFPPVLNMLAKGLAIVGALGVSGGSAEQDTALAAYGKSVFENLEGLSN